MLDVWKNVLAEVEQTIPREQFSTWFTGTELLGADNGVVVVGVPNVFKRTQLQAKYSEVIRMAFEHNGVAVVDLKYQVMSREKPRGARIGEGAMRPTAVATVASNNIRPSSSVSGSIQTGLNPRYTLDNFVIGSNNDLAVSVAQNIINNPGVSYNPFFLYGGPGLGKTHLVQAIGNALLQNNPKMKILYTPISSFYSEFIKSLQNKKSDAFREKYRKF